MPRTHKHIKHVTHHTKRIMLPPAPVPTINALAEMQPFEQSAGANLPAPTPIASTLQPVAPQYDANAQDTANSTADFADY